MASTAEVATGARQQTHAPNQFHLHGGHLSVSYFPQGSGPPTTAGPIVLTYQDAHHAVSFRRDNVTVVDAGALGAIVTVVLVPDHDQGSTTFSLVVPRVTVPDGRSVAIHTDAITSMHKGFTVLIGQDQTYAVTALRGTASDGPLPL
jgi:hypothetical protein